MGNVIGGLLLLPVKMAVWMVELLGRMAVLALGLIGLLAGALICGVSPTFIAGMMICAFSVLLITKSVDGH